jgi:hypothetical protein
MAVKAWKWTVVHIKNGADQLRAGTRKGRTRRWGNTVLNVKFCVFSYSRTKVENLPNNRTKDEN